MVHYAFSITCKSISSKSILGEQKIKKMTVKWIMDWWWLQGTVIYKNCIDCLLLINLKGKDLSHLPLANEEKDANILYNGGKQFETCILPFKCSLLIRVSTCFCSFLVRAYFPLSIQREGINWLLTEVGILTMCILTLPH